MKSGGPWNLRGLRPETRDAARETARRAGLSVDEWLTSVIRRENRDDDQTRFNDFDDFDDPADDWKRNTRRRDQPGPDESDAGVGGPYLAREEMREAERLRKDIRKAATARDEELVEEEIRAAALAREEFIEVHARLDRLSRQLDRMAQPKPDSFDGDKLSPPGGTTAPDQGADMAESETDARPRSEAPQKTHPRASPARVSVDAAVAEIAARQRELYGQSAAPAHAAPRGDRPIRTSNPRPATAQPGVDRSTAAAWDTPLLPAASSPGLATPMDTQPRPAADGSPVTSPPSAFASVSQASSAPSIAPGANPGGVDDCLREIAARIEAIQREKEPEKAIELRATLNEIEGRLKEAAPQRAVESVQTEIKALGQRIDHARLSGADAAALIGTERELGDAREALRKLMPAETLVGLRDAVAVLTQKLGLIFAKHDPAALQELSAAIDGLRGIASHVASDRTLAKVTEDVRMLAGKVDALAGQALSRNGFSSIETRLDRLVNALTLSAEAGHAVPKELENLLTGLIEKVERVQFSRTDYAALTHLEDRIALLIKRFDASDARLNQLDAIERGLADLLIHIDRVRGETRLDPDAHRAAEEAADAAIRQAMVEFEPGEASAPEPVLQKVPPSAAVGIVPVAAAPARLATVRAPIDPNLPPDYPLEPGLASGQARTNAAQTNAQVANLAAASATVLGATATDASSQPALDIFDLSLLPEEDFNAANEVHAAPPGKPSRRLRKLVVTSGAAVVALLALHLAAPQFEDGFQGIARKIGSVSLPWQSTENTVAQKQASIADAVEVPITRIAKQPPASPPPDAAPSDAASPPSEASVSSTPLPVITPDSEASSTPQPSATPGPVPSPAETSSTAAVAPPAGSPLKPPGKPLWIAPDITGTVPQSTLPTPSAGAETLPAAIGGPALRAAALAGVPSAEYEVGTRFADGRGVSQNGQVAALWLERAAKHGLAPAQFRLGSLYEKGIGVKKDLGLARDLYLAAANQGNGKAMHNLAVLYAEGGIGPSDYRTAAQWFRKAADLGITDSQFNLAVLYARGVGVEQNFAESYKWFVLAANSGDSEAARKRDEVAMHLDPLALETARLAAESWSPRPQPADATDVKAPPGGWDAQAAKPKPHAATAKPAQDVKAN